MNLPRAEDIIRAKVNALLDQLGCSLDRDVVVVTVMGDGVTSGQVNVHVHAGIDVQSFQVLHETPEGTPHAVEAG